MSDINMWYRRSVALEKDKQHVWMDFMRVLMRLKLIKYYNCDVKINDKLAGKVEWANIIINGRRYEANY